MQLMAGVYLKAAEIVETLDNYKGKKGRFVKTFAFNDKRNKNGWRALWDGIVKNIHTSKQKPGIVFERCTADGCDLDHTEAQTKELSLEVQEPFRKTNIIDYTLDPENHKSFFIHEVTDDETWEQILDGTLKFVSPSIWPKAGGFEVIGKMDNGLPMIDVWDWDFLHDAFVNKPAFGDDAKITAACEGVDCPVKLLSAKEFDYEAVFDFEAITDGESMPHLQEIPLSIVHKGKRRFITVSKTAYEAVQALLKAGEPVCEKKVFDIIRQEKQHSSFSSCTCSGSHNMDPKELESKFKAMEEDHKELQSKFSAMEDENKQDHSARVARLVATLKAMDEDKREEHSASIRAMHDEKEIKAMEEAEKEVKTAKHAKDDDKPNSAMEEENKDMKARIIDLEQSQASPLVAKMLKARELKGASAEEIKTFTESLNAKSLKEIESLYASERVLIEALVAKEPEAELKHFSFGPTSQSSLSAKSMDQIFNEEIAQ